MSDARNIGPEGKDDDSKWLELVTRQVKSLRYGVVEIIIHDGQVIQIEKTERVRLDKKPDRRQAD
jgi:hypothetical protein